MSDDPIHDEGYEAYYEGVEAEGNPYQEGTTNHDSWKAGWDEADEEGT